MECKVVKEQLTAFIQDNLSSEEHESVAAHLKSCAACNTEAGELRRALGILAKTEAYPSPDFVEKTSARVAAIMHAKKPARKKETADSSFITWLKSLYQKPHLAASIALHVVILFLIGYFIVIAPLHKRNTKKPKTISLAALRMISDKKTEDLKSGNTVSVENWLNDGKVKLVASENDDFFSVFSEKDWQNSDESKTGHDLSADSYVKSGKLIVPADFLAKCVNSDDTEVIVIQLKAKNIAPRVEVWNAFAYRQYEKMLRPEIDDEYEVKVSTTAVIIRF